MTYCWNFITPDTFYWVFSTLVQLFGALLALGGFFFFYSLDSLDSLDSIIKTASDNLKETTSDNLYKTRDIFINRSKKTITGMGIIVTYSIIILPFSQLLTNKLFPFLAIFILFICGIFLPAMVIYYIYKMITSAMMIRDISRR